jgi:Uma2 family endonuclease
MSIAPSKRGFTISEYLAFEEDSQTKHEFYQGEIFAMAGASIPHNEISGNIYHALRNALRGKDCRPYGSDLRIRVKKSNLYTYSDALVVCGTVERDTDDKNSVTNPRVIFEVLSKSTENYDRGKKWEFYQQLDSLREYILVSQEDAKVTRYFRRDGGDWHYLLIVGLDQVLNSESIACRIPLAEIYDNVTLGPENEPTQGREASSISGS